jgi:hypothetical protein
VSSKSVAKIKYENFNYVAYESRGETFEQILPFWLAASQFLTVSQFLPRLTNAQQVRCNSKTQKDFLKHIFQNYEM